jgi:hypothetical protein
LESSEVLEFGQIFLLFIKKQRISKKKKENLLNNGRTELFTLEVEF